MRSTWQDPPGYSRGRGNNFKALGNRKEAEQRVPQIVGISADEFMGAVALALTQGCGILLSPTGDGGAVSVLVYDGDDRYRTYASTPEEFADAISAVRDHAEAKMVGSTFKAPKVPRSAS